MIQARKPSDGNFTTAAKPSFSVAPLAATILFAAFQYMDQWPALLVKVYADDAFGPRAWVDDPGCADLVHNLALAHSEVPNDTAAQVLADADLMAKAYRAFELPTSPLSQEAASSPAEDSLTTSTPSVPRRVFSTARKVPNTGSSEAGDDLDSDSGDEEEEQIVSTNVAVAVAPATPPAACTYPLTQQYLNFQRVRQRFFGSNIEFARNLVGASLQDRLEQKSKQNSALLQCLPSFTLIPQVRSLVASNLSKWLQSPALASLARNLFANVVDQMQNVGPSLPDDLAATSSILAMRLKANQLSMHIENVTNIARRIPTHSIVRHIYAKLLREALDTRNLGMPSSDGAHLKMLGAIHAVVPAQVSYESIASSLLMIMVEPPEEESAPSLSRAARDRLVLRLRRLVRDIAVELKSFDGSQLVDALFSLDVSSKSWSQRDEEDKCRLMFQSATLAVAPFVQQKGEPPLSRELQTKLKSILVPIKKLLLIWCCQDYGPKKKKRRAQKEGKETTGAGEPQFNSALSPLAEETIPSWLNTMRCLLFLEDADSELLKGFCLTKEMTADDESEWESELARIHLCCRYGRDVFDEHFWVVLKSAVPAGGKLESSMAIQILENIVECCGRDKHGTLSVQDPMLVWELYNLAQYTPPDVADRPGEEIPR